MSSILKALKKLENEKAGRKPGSFKVDAEILREGASHSFSRISLFLVAVFLFICGVVATYFYMKPVAGTGLQAGSPIVTTGNQSVVSPATSPLAAARKQAPKEVDLHKESAPAGKQTAPSRPQSRFADKYPSPVSKSNDKSLTQPVKTLKIPVQARPNPTPVKPMETTGNQQPEHAPAPLLKVNGIAFQDGVTTAWRWSTELRFPTVL